MLHMLIHLHFHFLCGCFSLFKYTVQMKKAGIDKLPAAPISNPNLVGPADATSPIQTSKAVRGTF
jgi:hypothetical protein